jgi:hypothetical protein
MIADLEKLARLVEREDYLKKHVRVCSVAIIEHHQKTYPIYSYSIGTEDPSKPVLFITGGIHGLERIGAQLAWSLLKTTIDRLIWDNSLRELFKHIRLIIIPLLNPAGYYGYSRSNGNGVDLMRNSPVIAADKVPFLLGGHRFSSHLPWYQGAEGKLEIENQALQNIFNKEAAQSSCVISVDFHSGFGMKDRLWFPFSYTEAPFDHLAEMHALSHLFEQTHPYHIYQIEPQSKGYLLNGDMWDHLYLEYIKNKKDGIFLPMTLEMGSWTWVRKNPLQLFSKHGAFNPIKEHRIKRTYRRHHLLFDFLLRALYSNKVWSELDQILRSKHSNLALERWY